MFGAWPGAARKDMSLYWGEVDDETDMGRAGRYADQILARPRAYIGGGWTSTRWWAVWFALVSGKSEHAPLMCYAREFLNVLIGMTCIALVAAVLVLSLAGIVSLWWLLATMIVTALIVWRRLRYLRKRPYQTDDEI